MQLQENTIFDNHYTLKKRLGQGGFSEVWLAHDSYMDLDVALKIYAPGQGLDDSSMDVFRKEIKLVFSLNHQNLLCPKSLGFYENRPYLVMPYCAKGSLEKYREQLSEKQLWQLLHDVASGLDYLHQKNIVHQDIKPENILLDDSGHFLITDFGISTSLHDTLRRSVMRSTNMSSGTMPYMGPERFSKTPLPTKASDVWSLGVTIFQLIEGYLPFGEMGGGMQKAGAEIPEIKANVSASLKGTIEQMLDIETWNRPTAGNLVEIANNNLQPIDKGKTKPIATLFVSPENIVFNGGGETKTEIKISSQSAWTANSKSSWLHLVKKDNNSFCVYADENATGVLREGDIEVMSGLERKNIHVSQNARIVLDNNSSSKEENNKKDSNKSTLWIIIVFSALILLIAFIVASRNKSSYASDNYSNDQSIVTTSDLLSPKQSKPNAKHRYLDKLNTFYSYCKNPNKHRYIPSCFASNVYYYGEWISKDVLLWRWEDYWAKFNFYSWEPTISDFCVDGNNVYATLKTDITYQSGKRQTVIENLYVAFDNSDLIKLLSTEVIRKY